MSSNDIRLNIFTFFENNSLYWIIADIFSRSSEGNADNIWFFSKSIIDLVYDFLIEKIIIEKIS